MIARSQSGLGKGERNGIHQSIETNKYGTNNHNCCHRFHRATETRIYISSPKIPKHTHARTHNLRMTDPFTLLIMTNETIAWRAGTFGIGRPAHIIAAVQVPDQGCQALFQHGLQDVS
eukprot:scaffold3842_cov158-Amphora_coffeaeformis.AAC.8